MSFYLDRSRNETQIQRKMHFLKTGQNTEEDRSKMGSLDNVHKIFEAFETKKLSVRDIRSHEMHFHKTAEEEQNGAMLRSLYEIHKNFKAYDTSKLSVEDIMNTVFLKKGKKLAHIKDNKLAQMCAQSYICHRICKKALDFHLTVYFYTTYEPPTSKYEELTYILVDKHRLAGIAKEILKSPGKVLLHRCAETLPKSSRKRNKKTKEQTLKQRRWETTENYLRNESLRSIVGKFPNLIIPKLSSEEIEYYMKAKLKTFNVKNKRKQNTLKLKKTKALRKTKHGKENLPRNEEVRRSSRISAKKMAYVEINYAEDNYYSDYEEIYFQEDNVTIVKTQEPVNIIYTQEPVNIFYTQQPVNIIDTQQPMNIIDTQPHLDIFEIHHPLNIVSQEKEVIMDYQPIEQQVSASNELENLESYYQDVDYQNDVQNDQQNSNASEFSKNICLEEELVDYHMASSGTEISSQERYTLEDVFKTQMVVSEDACTRLKGELGFDKDVVESLRKLYESVRDGNNSYVYCELVY